MPTNKTKSKGKIITKREVVVSLPVVHSPKWLEGFVAFIREQGVVGLAVGLVLGVAAKSVVDSLVNNIFNPIVGLIGGGGELGNRYVCLKEVAGQCTNKLGYGSVVNSIVSFLVVAAMVYFLIKGLKLDKIDKKKT
ncbi:MscL family protein [Candidatus Saccharibacteria bacterium]|nr:MscL family protein [Candidatus Saccharibacteria bacterium]MBI3338472.1 MscL family protein [Candidatus Saccharibacteria bacterium]